MVSVKTSQNQEYLWILINNDLEIHKQVKTNEIKFQRFGDFMTPLSRNDLMNTVRVKKSSGQINLHKRS